MVGGLVSGDTNNANQCNTNAGTGPGQDLFGNRCDADLDCDGGVTPTDLGTFRDLFNRPPKPSGLQ